MNTLQDARLERMWSVYQASLETLHNEMTSQAKIDNWYAFAENSETDREVDEHFKEVEL